MLNKQYFMDANTSRRFLLAFASLTVAAVVAQTAYSVCQDRMLTIQSEHESGQVAVRLLEEHASQTLHDAARRVDTLVRLLGKTDLPNGLTQEVLNRALQVGEQDNRTLKAMQFSPPNALPWVTSIDYAAFEVDQDSRDYVGFLRGKSALRTEVLGRPFMRFYDQRYVMPLARNLYDLQNHYLGVLSTDSRWSLSSVSSFKSNVSRYPCIAVNGVRKSWDALLMDIRRAWSTRSRW